MTRGEWARAFLAALGNSSPDDRTVNWVASWTLGENTQAAYNPLATTQPSPCATGDFNFAHVKNYSNHQCGIEASVKTLQNGHYPHILHGLQNNDPEEASNAVELGTWGTGMGFVTLWRLGDHRGETLKSHESAPQPFGPIHGGGGSWDDPPDPKGPQLPSIDLGLPQLPDSTTIARSLIFVGLGGLLVTIAIVMAIRTYVPTEQIVKTVAAVAA